MPRSAREISSALERKGFERRESKDAYFHLWVDGKKTPIYTKMSQGEREIHDGLLGAMARQLRLRKAQFDDLVECPLSKEDYVGILREEGHISEEAVAAPPPPGNGTKPARKRKKRKKRSG
jgi:hypothetical protein